MTMTDDEKGITLLSAYVGDILNDPRHASLDSDSLPEHLHELGEKLALLGLYLKEAQELSETLADGKITTFCSTHCENIFIAPLKTLQSNLLHLAWTARCIAEGDDDQHISFMSDLSSAFNTMIERHREQKASLEKIASMDALTGVGNRMAFNRDINTLWGQSKPFSMAFIDLDNLKFCNDSRGHAEGDSYIQKVCSALKTKFAHNCRMYRIGGDEFALISEAITEQELSSDLQECRNLFLEEYGNCFEVQRSFSFGCVHAASSERGSLDSFIAKADKLMYADKGRADRRMTRISQDSSN